MMMQWRRFLLVVLLTTVSSSLFVTSAPAASEDEYYELMKVFVDTFEEIDRNYVTQVDKRELVEAAMRGMLLKLDPYSSYIDKQELRSFNEHVDQEFGGIGIQVTIDPKTRQLMVMTPLPGTPAYKAGVLAGDRILEIDDKPTADFQEGREMDSAINLMRGKPGVVVKIKLLHEGSESPETIQVTRATIKTPTVYGDHYDSKGEWSFFLDEKEKIGYIRLTSFGRNSAEELHDALLKLQKEGMRALILDMRFNPGGLLTAATAIADFFISNGVIVSTKGRNTEEQFVKAKKAGTFSGFPMAVLVNRYSASASEIVSACLQDYKRAIIVGERTWGKGSVDIDDKPEVRWKITTDFVPGISRVVAAHHIPVLLHEQYVRTSRMHGQPMDTVADLGIGIGNMLRRQSFIDRPPRLASVVRPEGTSRRNRDENSSSMDGIQQNRMQAHSPRSGHPLASRPMAS